MAVSGTAQSRSTDDVELPIPNFIGGEWMRSSTSDALPVHDPGTGELEPCRDLGRDQAGDREC